MTPTHNTLMPELESDKNMREMPNRIWACKQNDGYHHWVDDYPVWGKSVEYIRASQSPPCAEVTREEYDLIWEKAYNDSRGSNVFNEIPSFKKCLTDAMIKRGLLTLLEKNRVGG